jgi:hypothetical protein
MKDEKPDIELELEELEEKIAPERLSVNLLGTPVCCW